MGNTKQIKLDFKKIVSFFALTAFFTMALNLPTIFLSQSASAAVASAYTLTALTTTDISVGASDFKVMEFVIPDSSAGTQDTLLLDGSNLSYNGNSLVPFPSNVMFINQGGGVGYQSGDDIVKDLDGDGVYTTAADFLVDADGVASTTTTATALNAGDTLYDIVASDYLFTDSISSPTKLWNDKDHDSVYTSQADIFVDADGVATAGSGTENFTGSDAGSSFADFVSGDNVYYYNSSGTTILDGLDDIETLWLSSGNATYEVSSTATATGSAISLDTVGSSATSGTITDYFVIDTTNDAFVINVDGGATGDQTITIANASYTGATLATALDVALESATDLNGVGNDDVTVSYDVATDQFTITNNFASAFDLKWNAAASEAEDVLGYSNAAADTLTATGGTAISDNAVAFNIITGTNDQLDITTDGTLRDDVTIDAGVYTGTTLAANLQTKLRAVTSSNETVTYAGNKFIITSAITNLTSTASSIAIAAGATDARATFGFTTTTDVIGSFTTTNTIDDILAISYSFYDGANGISTLTDNLDFGTSSWTTIGTLATSVNTAIGVSSFSATTDFIGSVGTNNVILTTIKKGYGVSVQVTGGTGQSKFGFTTPVYSGGGDSIIYDTVGITAGSSGTSLVSSVGVDVVYHDVSGSASGYQSTEPIYIDFGGRTYTAAPDGVALDTAGDIAEGQSGTNVAATAGWVKSVNSTYSDGDDIFIENIAGELTYSAAADTMLVNGSFGSATLGVALVAFDADQKFVDNDGNVTYDAGEDIYKNAAGAGGTTVEYEAVNDITVSNGATTNAVDIANITAVKIFYEENTGTPTFDGTEDYISFSKYPVATPTHWRATGQNIQIPDNNGLKVYVTITVNASISEGQKIKFQLDLKSDAGSDGIYQAGDRGIFVSTSDDGPSDQAVQSTEVTVSAFGDLFSDLEDAVDDFEKEIKDVRDPDDDDSFDDYSDDSEDYLGDLEDALAVTIDTNSEVSTVFDSLVDIVGVFKKHVGLIKTTGEYAISANEYEDISDALDDVKTAADAIVAVVDDLVEADANLSSNSFDDERDDFDDDYDELEDSLLNKDPEKDDIEGIIRFLEGLVDDLDEIETDDVPNITISGEIDDTDDIFDDVIDVLNDAKKKIEDMDESKDYDEDDLNDLEDLVDDLKDASDDVFAAADAKVTALANANFIDDFDDEEYDDDIDEMNEKVSDAFDLLSGSEVSSEDVDEVIDNLESIEDDVNNLDEDVDDLIVGISEANAETVMEDVFDALIEAYEDAADEVGSLPCTTSDDDINEVEDAVDDVIDAVKDMKNSLEDALTTVSHMTALNNDFEDFEDDLKDEKDTLEDELDEIKDLEGRCEDTDESGPASIVVVADSYTLSVDNEGVDTSNIVATVRDKSSELLDNRLVEFTISSPLSNGGKLSLASKRTDSLGQVSVEYTPGSKTEGTVTIKVYSSTNVDVNGTVQLKVVNSQVEDEVVDNEDEDIDIDEGDNDDNKNVNKDDDKKENEEPATVGVIDSVLDPAQGGLVKVQVESENGKPIEGEQVTLSLRSGSGKITSYTVMSDVDGIATFAIPQTDFAPDEDYAAIVSSVSAPQATSGIFEIKSDEGGVNDGQGEGQVLGVSDTNSDVASDSGDSGSSSGAMLPTTGMLPLVTFVFSSVGSALMVFRKED